MESRFSENVRTLRKHMHLTQEQLAEAMGVTVGAAKSRESPLHEAFCGNPRFFWLMR